MKLTNFDNYTSLYVLEVEKNALDFVRKYALPAFAGIMTSLSSIAILLYFELQTSAPIIWIICVTLMQTASLFLRRKLPLSGLTHKRKLHIVILFNMIDGFVIASCILFIPYINDILRTVLIFSMVTSCLGATITTMGYQPLFLAFSVPVSFSFLSSPLLSIYLWGGTDSLYVVFIISCTICGFIYSVSRGIRKNYKNAIVSNLKNIETNEKLQKAMQEAKIANQSKTRFFASASHDLRQPINTISLFVATLSLKKLNPEDTQIVKNISSAVNTIDTQLSSLLEISKLDSGALKTNKSDINVISILEDMMNIYRDQNLSESLFIDFTSDFNSVLSHTDQTLFERIISNLVVNSIKYTPAGSITVSVKPRDENYISIFISDTGIGISKSDLAHIYDEFFQANNPERDGKEGFGLGLSIVKRLCILLDVEITITSKVGKGTNIQLDVPFLECETK